jgi:protein-disulfide isomerase
MNSVTKSGWFLPGAIVFAGAVIAFAIYATAHHTSSASNGNPQLTRPVSTTDHVLGNPTAPVVLIEYTDTDSEYSKDFQGVMEQVIQDYGPNGNVAWVYRDYPLVDQDVNSEKDDEAAECVAGLSSGSTSSSEFFSFIDAMQAAAPGDSQFDPTNYDSLVTTLGISTGSFDDCLSAHTYEKKVEADYNNGVQIGVSGTPYSILEVKGQKPVVISGYVPYATMKQVLDTSIQKALATQ